MCNRMFIDPSNSDATKAYQRRTESRPPTQKSYHCIQSTTFNLNMMRG